MFQRWSVLLLFFAGCSSIPGGGLRPKAAKPETPPRWDWVSALPGRLPRAEIVPPTVTNDALAAIVGEEVLTPIRLASTAAPPSAYRIIQLSGRPVRNCQELYAGLERVRTKQTAIPLVVEDASASSGQPMAMEIEPARISVLEQVTSAGHKALTVADGGNTWVMLRENGVCLKLHARVERGRGLLHLVMSCSMAFGNEALLPEEVRAWCDGKPLRCLTAADALERLYQPHKAWERLNQPVGPASAPVEGLDAGSFAAVSDRPDYRVPVNLPRLRDETAELPPSPALAAVPGTRYPGSPLIGDARALAAFLQQRELCRPGGPERTGWILFAGEHLKRGRLVEVAVTHPGGSNRVSFELPSP